MTVIVHAWTFSGCLLLLLLLLLLFVVCCLLFVVRCLLFVAVVAGVSGHVDVVFNARDCCFGLQH